MAKKLKAKRAMRINMADGSYKDLPITQAVAMKTSKENDNRIYLEQLTDGTYRLLWTEDLITEFKDVQGFEMIREDV
jgi:hypothetical protein